MLAEERRQLQSELEYGACAGRLNETVWALFRRYQNRRIIERKILFFKLSLYVRDLRGLLEDFFGPEPEQYLDA